ncbi:MAG: Txe/YoeB family addiction module toxin [Dehalococcoidia bacterium]
MRLTFTESGWSDYGYWFETDPAVTRRIHALLRDALRTPTSGIGKPERLRGNLSGRWSRRITGEHRMVYAIEGDEVVIESLRYHYRPERAVTILTGVDASGIPDAVKR